MSARKTVRLPGPFTMRNGGVLPQVDVAYETWGRLTPARDNVLLLVTGLSPSAHARSSAEDPTPGWWEEMVGPGKAIDTDRFHVVCVNSLGSPHGSTGPASIDPRTGQPLPADVPGPDHRGHRDRGPRGAARAGPRRACARWSGPRWAA